MYDARAQSDSAGLTRQIASSAVVGIIVLGMLALAFLWPTETQRKQTQIDSYQLNLARADSRIIPMAMPDLKLAGFERSILELDKSAHTQLSSKLKQSADQAQAIDIAFAEIESILSSNTPLLARADIRYADAMLALTRNGLRSAAASQSPYCQGTHYSMLAQDTDPARNALILARGFASQIPAVGQYSTDMATLMFQAAADARRSASSHGPLTSVDKAAIEGVLVSLLDDPDIKKIARALKANEPLEPVITSMDMCLTGTAAITAISTLPQDTKARLWADILSNDKALKTLTP